MPLRLICSSAIFLVVCVSQIAVHAQLRIVTYNTLDNPRNATDDSNFTTIFDAIGTKDANGIAKRVDIIAVQEQTTFDSTSTAERMAGLLNTLYGVGSYSSGLTILGTDLVGVVYDTSTVTLLSNVNVNTTGPRFTYRGQFRPVGYTSSDADFYLYSSHFKAGNSQSDIDTREDEGQFLSNNADNLGPGKNIIFSGDFNFKVHTEPGYANLLGAGDGKGNDPLSLAFWPNSFFAEHMTQSTRVVGGDGAGGGMDDRFDLQIISDELLDGEGLTYIGPTSTGLGGLSHSYQAFGNDGTSWDQAITTPTTGRSQPTSVLNALHDFSDHLPVFADYQLPAVMQAALTMAAPATVDLNDVVPLDVLVENIADVLAAVGADELDYTLNVSGDLFGGGIGDMTLALSGGNTHQVTLDTSSIGSKSGTITVSSSSLAAENSLVEINVNFDVTAGFLEADFNEDTFVNGADLAQWEGDYGINGDSDADGDGESTGFDFLIWQQQNGQSTALSTSVAAVPETSTLGLAACLIILSCCLSRRGSQQSAMAR